MTGSHRRFVGLLAIALVLSGALAWHAAVRSARPANVVIITLDTTRADRLSPYGLMDAPMPALDALAGDGVVFDQATTVAPLTLPAHTSLFTGLFPPAHGVRDNASAPLDERFATLAGILQRRGFRTGAFIGSMVLGPERGLARGFDRYGGIDPRSPAAGRAQMGQRRADAVVDDALQWLEEAGGAPFLLWAHLYDPHRPYAPPEPFRSRHADPYIGEIAFADSQIARLLEAIDLDRTIVVVAGDHGESLGDHGERDHGVFVYESVIRVPLIVRTPGTSAARIPGVVRLVDVMPTVLDLLGIPPPPIDGVSLSRLLSGTSRDLQLEAYAESEYPRRLGWSPVRSLREGRFKLIDAPRPELYDLERDPFEDRNIHGERPSIAAAMTRRLRELAPAAPGRGEAARAPVPRELAEGLAALGYAGARGMPAPSGGEALPDPKDCIGLLDKMPAGGTSPSSPAATLRCQDPN
jgi:arylsulfatase A-like enzyme